MNSMLNENTPFIMMRTDFFIKFINISASLLVVGLVLLVDAEKLYPDYVKGTSTGAILYLFFLSGYGAVVSKSLSLVIVKFYLYRIFYAWIFTSLPIIFIFFSGKGLEYLNLFLISASVLVNVALVTPWLIHVLPILNIAIVWSRIIFWVAVSLSIFLDNFWILYLLISFFGGLQLILSLHLCKLNHDKQKNLQNDVVNHDIWSFKFREIGSRLNENLANYLAASFFDSLNVIIFHITMKFFSLASSLLYIPVRARLRGSNALDYSTHHNVAKYLIKWCSIIIATWLIVLIFDNEVLSIFLYFNATKVTHQFFYFVMQPSSIIIVILAFFHVYMKAKKDISIWPNISIKLELFSILLSMILLIAIFFTGLDINTLIFLGWHILVLINRDLIVFKLYKRLEF